MDRATFENYWNRALEREHVDEALRDELTDESKKVSSAFYDALEAMIDDTLKQGFLLGLSYATWLNECD